MNEAYVYLDGLLAELRDSGCGCFMDEFVGAAAFADDLALLSPSRDGLQLDFGAWRRLPLEFEKRAAGKGDARGDGGQGAGARGLLG